MDKLPINPGTILLTPASRVEGGKVRRTQKVAQNATNGGAGEAIEYKVEVEVADLEERKNAENLVARGMQIVRRHSTHTLIGYLAAPDVLPEVIGEYSKLRLAADQFNASAKFSHVSISFAPFEIGTQLASNEECAKALADHVRGELTEMRTKLLAGDVVGTRNVLLRCKRMHTLSVGTQADAIKFAIEEGAGALKILGAAIKRSETPESAGRALAGDPAKGVRSLLAMLDSAIETFTYAPENHAPELPADLTSASVPSTNPVALIAA